MKQNTQKLLTWLYSPADRKPIDAPADRKPIDAPTDRNPRAIDYQQLALILPDMTPGGRRSLIYFLTQKHLICTNTLGGKTTISLTSHGTDALISQFPVFSKALREWQGEWSMLIFHKGPKGDPHFRYLRQLLLDQHAFSLSRGVYLYPGELPSQVSNLCKEMYVGAVTVAMVSQWIFGDERRAVSDHYILSDIAEIYSGISNEINQLLETQNEQKRLTKKVRLQIYSVFDRLFNVLSLDPGFLHYYYPQLPTAEQLLNQLHSVLILFDSI